MEELKLGRVDYAAGIFNGIPNAQLDLSNPKSVIAYLNFAPFRPATDSLLENFNIGGSLVAAPRTTSPSPRSCARSCRRPATPRSAFRS